MTIKQLGGIFGRNPTFNDVTIDGGIYFEDGQSGKYLDDYEEGTWTPAIQGNVSPGAGTYSNQQGFYTKVGNVVTVYASVTWTGHTGSGSGIRLSDLPFTSNATYGSMLNGQISDITLSANNYFTGALVRTSDTRADLFQSVIGGTSSGLISFDTSGTLRLSGHYYI
jgi:hypothetical protein